MAILARLPGLNPNLFSRLPTNPLPNNATPSHPSPPPPIPIPKYPPPLKSQKRHSPKHPPPPPPQKQPPSNTAFKTHHTNSKYYKPVKPGQVISSEDDRSVIIGGSGVSYRLRGAPFDFQFSYSETPKVEPLAIREPAFLPFAPPTMPRPWTGKAPMKKTQKKIPLFESLNSPPARTNAVKQFEMPRTYWFGRYSEELKPREELLGEPLSRTEIRQLISPHLSSNRQVNLGRDGLTHNMLELIHTHWRRHPVCKVRCLGIPTVDMDNVCRCLEEKTGGKIIHRLGGVVYLFRGRNYDPRTRPQYPVMLWKPAAPVYPKLIQEAPEGLTKEEADEFRKKGKDLLPICKLAKNGVYTSLVQDVRNAFEQSPLVKIDCTGLHASDYKKIGAKLKELVPCVLLSFEDEQILIWRGQDWKSMYKDAPSALSHACLDVDDGSGNHDVNYSKLESKTSVSSSPRMMSLWTSAMEANKALLLDEIGIDPDELLKKVEEFESVSQATEHSYPALILSNENNSKAENHEGSQDEYHEEDEISSDNNEISINDLFKGPESSVALGSLPVDLIAQQLSDNEGWIWK